MQTADLLGFEDFVLETFAIREFYSHSERYSLRGKDELKLKKNYARTNTFKFCYFNRIVHMWNGLPLSVRQAPSVSCFKRGVRDYLTARSD